MPSQQDNSKSLAQAMQTFAAMLCTVESLAERVEKMSEQLEIAEKLLHTERFQSVFF